MYPSPVVARRNQDYYIKIAPETVKVLSYVPLDQCPFKIQEGGIVVVLTCNPKQGLYLARSASYHMGGAIRGITGPSTCSIIMGGPFQSGEMLASLGCYGGRLSTWQLPRRSRLKLPKAPWELRLIKARSD